MTASQLIELLGRVPPNTPIIIDLYDNRGGTPPLGLHIDARDGDVWIVTDPRAVLHHEVKQ